MIVKEKRKNKHEVTVKASKKYREKMKNNKPKRYHEMWVLSKYCLTTQDYEQILKEQDNKCAICGEDKSSPRFIGRNFYVDHNHKTGEIRGLLCQRCNAGLGYFEDSSALLEKARQYLKGGEQIACN